MDLGSLTGPAEIISALGGIVYTAQKIVKELKKAKEASSQKILNQAKAHADEVKLKLESEIANLESQLHNLKVNVEKDLSNLKENHTIELKNLSERVELLRNDLQIQTTQILNLLGQLVNKS